MENKSCKLRLERKETINKYIIACNKLKEQFNDKTFSKPYIFSKENKINSKLFSWLFEKNVIYREYDEEGIFLYKWDEKIPITPKLFLTFLDDMREINYKAKLKRKITMGNGVKEPTLFDKANNDIEVNINPPKIKQEKTVLKRQPKQVIEQPQQELGLIRRFLKWVY